MDRLGIHKLNTPYCYIYNVDTISSKERVSNIQSKYIKIIQLLVGSLNWLSISTVPNSITFDNLLAKRMSKPTEVYI